MATKGGTNSKMVTTSRPFCGFPLSETVLVFAMSLVAVALVPGDVAVEAVAGGAKGAVVEEDVRPAVVAIGVDEAAKGSVGSAVEVLASNAVRNKQTNFHAWNSSQVTANRHYSKSRNT